MSQFPDVFRIAAGWNNVSIYQPFPVAPYYDGLTYPRQITPPNGMTFEDGKPFALLRFKGISAANYVLLLSRSGVTSAKSALVTVRLPDKSRLGYADWNGIAIQPELGSDAHWNLLRYPDVLLRVNRLKAVS